MGVIIGQALRELPLSVAWSLVTAFYARIVPLIRVEDVSMLFIILVNKYIIQEMASSTAGIFSYYHGSCDRAHFHRSVFDSD
jgi:hypothetical protein